MAYTRIRSTTQHSHPNRYAQNLISPICSPINGTQRFFLPCLSATAMPPRRAAVARRRMPISATREDYSVQNTEAATINTVWRSIHEEETWWNGPTWRYPKERGLYWSWAERMGVFFFFPICLFSFFSLFSHLFSVLLLISISVQIYTEFRFAHKQQSSSMYANMFLMYIVTLTTLFIYVDKCFKYAMHTLFIFKEIIILNL